MKERIYLTTEENLKDKNFQSKIEKVWIDKKTGFLCVILLIRNSHRCGYVGVPKGHKLYKKDYTENGKIENLDVHGGVTFSDFLLPGEDYWFFGFDCAHTGDAFSKSNPARLLFEDALGAGQEAERERILEGIENIKNVYPEDIFPKIELEEWQRDKLNEFLESNFGFPIDRFSAELMRRARNNLCEELTKQIKEENKK